MNYSQLKESVAKMLTEQFPCVSSNIENTEYGGSITSFMLQFKNEDDLKRLWQEIVSAIAFYFQTRLETDFEKWNLYVFFLLPTPIGKETKYKIENDPVSSRKIVVDCYNNEPFTSIISEHITNDSLRLAVKENVSNDKLVKNPIIWEEFEKISINKLNSKKKGSDPYIIETLESIEKRLRS